MTRRRAALAAVLAAGIATLLAAVPARAQVVEFQDTPSVTEVLELLAPEVPRARSMAPPTPRIIRDQIGGASLATPSPPAARPAPKPAGARPPRPAIAQPDVFASGSADLPPKTQALLEQVAKAMRAAPGLSIVVSGHTDATGDLGMNTRLGLLRAVGARNFIAAHGVDAGRVLAVTAGPLQPLPGLDPTDPRNRRIQYSRWDALPAP